MAHESFEDEATAAELNARFVNVKVDREERPDVDAIYMKAVQGMTWAWRLAHVGVPHAHGGAVLRRHLLPAGRPPRHAVLPAVVRSVSDAWVERRDEVIASAARDRRLDRAGRRARAVDVLDVRHDA
jgi:uncharacterized protein